MSDLSLVPLEDIWNELRNRYEAIVLLTVKDMDKHREARTMNSDGGRYACLGLVTYAQDRILDDIAKDDP